MNFVRKPICVSGVVIAGSLAVALFLLLFFVAILPGKRTICYEEDLAAAGEEVLRNCFGDDYKLSEGVEKEYEYFEYHDQVNVTVHYREWTLSYRNAGGEEQDFVFHNQVNSIESFTGTYFCELTEDFYKRNFWDEAVAGIPGVREDSVLYFQEYSQFSSPSIPKSSVMLDRQLHYSLAEHICFPRLEFDRVFEEFPYLLRFYVYATYESPEEGERQRQRQETEERLRHMVDEIIAYTGGTLNATVGVTMMDQDGYVDGFGFRVLNGEYFQPKDGLEHEYDIALHEHFFGPIVLEDREEQEDKE